MVGMMRFELMIFCSQSRRGNQAALHPDGAPDKIRTRDPQIRSLLLYPAELLARAQMSDNYFKQMLYKEQGRTS